MRASALILALLIGSAHAATPVQRQTAIVNALIDGTATNQQLTAVADAFVASLTDAQCSAQFGHACAALTNAEKATVVVQTIRRDIINRIAQRERAVAVTAAQAAIDAAAAAGRDVIALPEDPANAQAAQNK